MSAEQKIVEKLTKVWEKADAVWKKAAKNAHQATAKYHWTAADDGWKWRQVIALRDRERLPLSKRPMLHGSRSWPLLGAPCAGDESRGFPLGGMLK